jgi:hypothetical protein
VQLVEDGEHLGGRDAKVSGVHDLIFRRGFKIILDIMQSSQMRHTRLKVKEHAGKRVSACGLTVVETPHHRRRWGAREVVVVDQEDEAVLRAVQLLGHRLRQGAHLAGGSETVSLPTGVAPAEIARVRLRAVDFLPPPPFEIATLSQAWGGSTPLLHIARETRCFTPLDLRGLSNRRGPC